MIQKAIAKKYVYFLLFFLLLMTITIYFSTYQQGHDWGDDFSLYLMQAESIVDGGASIAIPEQYSSPMIAPWGFPLILSPIYYFFGMNILFMKIYISMFFFLSLIIIFLLFNDRLEPYLTLIIVAIFAFNPYFFLFKDNILTDIPFFCISLFGILLIQKVIIEKKEYWNKTGDLFVIGAVIFLAFFIRYPGVILLFTLFICQLIVYFQRIYNQNPPPFKTLIPEFIPYLSFIVCEAITILFFSAATVSGKNINPYLQYLTFSNLLSHLQYFLLLPSEFFDIYWPDINPYKYILYAATLIFVVLGIAKNFRKDHLFLIFSFSYFGLYVIVGGQGGLRYLFPILPFYWYFFFIGLISISIRIPKIQVLSIKISFPHIVGICIIICSCIGIAFLCNSYALLDKNTIIEGPFENSSGEMFAFVTNTTNNTDEIIFFKPRVMTLMTGRRSTSLKEDYDSIAHSNASYYVYYIPWDLSNYSIIKDHKINFKTEFENKNFFVFKIIRNGTESLPKTVKNSDRIRYFIDKSQLTEIGDNKTLSVTGWAFISGIHSTGTNEYLVLSSANASYTFDTVSQRRRDLVLAFKDQPQDVEWSGFQADIPLNILENGTYNLGIIIQSDDEALQTISNVKITVP